VAELALLIERPMSIADYSIAGVETRSRPCAVQNS